MPQEGKIELSRTVIAKFFNFFRFSSGVISVSLGLAALGLCFQPGYSRAETGPVYVGFDGEFGLPKSISAEQIEKGIRIAIDEINRAGGVLGGRPLELMTKSNRSMPARGLKNIQSLAKVKDMAAVVSGRFSPVVLQSLKILHETRMINLAAWSSADPITKNGYTPNYVFRLSLRDSLAMPAMLGHLKKRGIERVGLLLTNTSWGPSNEKAAAAYLSKTRAIKSVGTKWYQWRATSMIAEYEYLKNKGAQAIVLVGNDDEGATLLKEVAQLPKNQRLPIVSHWGVTGGDFVRQAGEALFENDFAIIQSVSFLRMRPKKVEHFLKTARRLYGIKTVEEIDAPVGVAHAYDLIHILARAINLAGSTDRSAIRDAMERVRDYDGLIKFYKQPFAAERHDALGLSDLLLARYDRRGVLIPIK